MGRMVRRDSTVFVRSILYLTSWIQKAAARYQRPNVTDHLSQPSARSSEHSSAVSEPNTDAHFMAIPLHDNDINHPCEAT